MFIKIISHLKKLQKQNKIPNARLYLSIFGILIFLTTLITLPIINNQSKKDKSITDTYAAAATISPSFFGMHYSSAIYQPWPTASFSALRLWDQWPGIYWPNLNPSQGTYDWSGIDQVVNTAVSHNVDIVYTFGHTPA